MSKFEETHFHTFAVAREHYRSLFQIEQANAHLDHLMQQAGEAIDQRDANDHGPCILHQNQPDYGEMEVAKDGQFMPTVVADLYSYGEDKDREMIDYNLERQRIRHEKEWKDAYYREAYGVSQSILSNDPWYRR